MKKVFEELSQNHLDFEIIFDFFFEKYDVILILNDKWIKELWKLDIEKHISFFK